MPDPDGRSRSEIKGSERPPDPLRIQIEYSDGKLRIQVPPNRGIVPMIAFPFWLITVIVGGYSLAGSLIDSWNTDLFTGNVVAALIFVAMIAVMSILFLWQVLGAEIIRLSASQLIVERSVLGLSRKRVYDVENLSALRPYPDEMPFWSSLGGDHWFSSTGRIAADYGRSTVRFASSLSETEIEYVIGEMKQTGYIKD